MFNYKKTPLIRFLCFALCALFLCAPLAAMASEDDAIEVRVGFFAFEGYHEQSEDGSRAGYGYEMLQHLAGYANFRYKYIGYDKSWSEMQDMLERGEIDILTSAQKTDEREARFDFTETNIGVSAAMLTVKAGDMKYLQSDYTNWSGIRVGMIKDSSRNDSFASYATQHRFTYQPIYFESTDEMVMELAGDGDRRIDAILTSNLRKIKDETILAQFDSSPFFIMVQKGRRDLLERLDSAITQMDTCEPGMRTKLMNKYYSQNDTNAIVLTAQEREYIRRMKNTKFTALINPDRAPYSWIENGKLKGIIYDAASEMIARSGLWIEFVVASDRQEYGRMIDERSVDIRFDVAYSYNMAEKNAYWLTAPYATVPVARIYRKITTDFRTAAVPQNRDISDTYAKEIIKKGLEVTYYNSTAEAVQAVADGKEDTAFLAVDSATMAVRNDITNRLAASEVFGDEISYAVAINQDQSPLLYSILNKAAMSLGEKTIDDIRLSYAANLKKPFSIIGYFYDYPLHAITAVAVLLSIVILIIALYSQYRRRKAAAKYLKKEQEANALLKDALGAAERADAAKSQFLSRVSHEMRTPLNAIIGFLELAKDADSEQVATYMASSDIAAKQLLNVINDVLDMSSIESGKLKIADAPFNFRHLISSLTNIYGTQCKQKGISFEAKITTPTEDWISGDELRVNQILMNLLGNAVKFTQKGTISLTVSQTREDEERIFMRFVVSDTGCGMSEEMKERLFKPFEQESAMTAKKYGGSGLGLSIVKNLVAMMSGSIRVESKPDVGTSFTVDLPFSKAGVENSATLPKNVKSLRVLAVDDEKSEREYISVVLKRMGVGFKCVSSGAEALREMERADAANESYNVCIVDWRMPDMNGIDTTSRIRERYGSDVVVIVVSAYDFQQVGESAKKAGANMCLSKPLFQSSLFDLFMTLTNGAVANTASEPQSWDFTGKRVLLAEDNTLNQIVAKGYLAKYNVVVDLAEDGKKAVDKFTASANGYYDAILMDIQMPIMDGFEATRAIRASAHPQAKSIQIIAQTADAFNEDIARVLSAGMDAHVAKPIKPELLARALRAAFSKKENG